MLDGSFDLPKIIRNLILQELDYFLMKDAFRTLLTMQEQLGSYTKWLVTHVGSLVFQFCGIKKIQQ